jgi:hypothetical protein
MLSVFEKKPHFGEKRVPMKFKLHVKSIHFEMNKYFVPESSYSIFQTKDHTKKLKSKTSLLSVFDLSNIAIDETLKFHATLFEKHDGSFASKTRKIIIRQNTKIDGEDCYRDIGYVALKLDHVVNHKNGLDCTLELVDPDKLMKARIDLNIKYKYIKESNAAINASMLAGQHSAVHDTTHEGGIKITSLSKTKGVFGSTYSSEWGGSSLGDSVAERDEDFMRRDSFASLTDGELQCVCVCDCFAVYLLVLFVSWLFFLRDFCLCLSVFICFWSVYSLFGYVFNHFPPYQIVIYCVLLYVSFLSVFFLLSPP